MNLTVSAVQDVLGRVLVPGSVVALNAGLATVLGSKNPNLVPVPLTPKGAVDVGALLGTALDPTCEWLDWGGVRIPAPVSHGLYALDRGVGTRKGEPVDLGLCFDLEGAAVTVDSLAKGRGGLADVRDAFRLQMAKLWESVVLEAHRGPCLTLVAHTRCDVGVHDVVLDRATDRELAAALRVPAGTLRGLPLHLTRQPLVTADCTAPVRILVLDTEDAPRYVGMHPVLIKRMGGDNDGDTVTVHQLTVRFH